MGKNSSGLEHKLVIHYYDSLTWNAANKGLHTIGNSWRAAAAHGVF